MILEDRIMPLYIMLSNITDEGAEIIKRRPERIKEVNTEIETFGVKVIAQYATLGPYDFVNIVEAEDNLAVARVSAELAARSTIKITTMPAIEIDDFIGAFS
jgi:uncharacterized protein with GYD domain